MTHFAMIKNDLSMQNIRSKIKSHKSFRYKFLEIYKYIKLISRISGSIEQFLIAIQKFFCLLISFN